MSVLTKGLALDFVRQGRKNTAITSKWPASVIVWCQQLIESAATGKHVDPITQRDLRRPVS